MNISSSNSTINEWLKDLVKAKALALFETERDVPNYRIGQARNICRKLTHSSDDSFIQFPNRYGRHTTLAGVWMFLEKDHKREYLITAFGKRKGTGLSRPAQYYGLHVSHGTAHHVNFSPSCIDYFQKHVSDVDNAEILICHNHPRHFLGDLLSQMMRWDPLPSNADRETMYQFKHRAIVNWLITGSFKNVRFFLVENLALREIQLPPVERICQALNWLNAHTNPISEIRHD